MSMVIAHPKVNAIADWTQAELDHQIVLGNYQPGTTLADITLPSDWNDDHSVALSTSTYMTSSDPQQAIDDFANAARREVLVDMGGDNYTMTDDESIAGLIIVVNGGVGKTLTFSPTAEYRMLSTSFVVTAYLAAPISIAATAGSTSPLANPFGDLIIHTPAVGAVSMFEVFVNDTAYASSWNGNPLAPSKNAVYDKIESLTDDSYTDQFLFMGG